MQYDDQTAMHALSTEERSAVLTMNYEDAYAALEKEDPAVLAVTTEFVLDYSEKAGFLLKEGRDYLDLLAPLPELPAVERIAREIVLETLEDELNED